jgi:hypothetical protein
MTFACLNANPLKRDGTSQSSRLLHELLPGYVSVDERSMQDLAEYAFKIASEFKFFHFDGIMDTSTDWQPFFDLADSDWENFDLDTYLKGLKETQESDPHIALFLAFLTLFKIAQKDLNTITQRHLEFYYRDVLKFSEKPAIPDQVILIFKLAKQVNQHLITKGTDLKGGKDAIGVQRIYDVIRNTAVSKASISEIRAVFTNLNNEFTSLAKDPLNIHKIYASSIANSSDGVGADLETEQKEWRTFGRPSFPNIKRTSSNALNADRPFARIGFAVASPILFLEEGNRTVTVSFSLNKTVTIPGTDALKKNEWKAFLSGEKEWISATIKSVSTAAKTLTIVLEIGEDLDPIVKYDGKTLFEPIDTKWPVLKLELNQSAQRNPALYKLLKSAKVKDISLTTHVTGVRNVIIQNDEGILDNTKPFMPFGSRPKKGSQFLIGSWEVFQKKLTSLKLRFRWKGMPEQSFGGYYHDYGSYEPENSLYTVNVSLLEDRQWRAIDGNRPLITNKDGNAIADNTYLTYDETKRSLINIIDVEELKKIESAPDLPIFKKWETSSQQGFMKFTLKKDFGHLAYPNAFANQAIALSKHKTGTPPKLPNTPYTPQFEDFVIEYTASIKFQPKKDGNVDEFYHLHPFGAGKQSGSARPYIIPKYTNEGELYIGIKDLEPRQTLSILYQIAEGSANPDKLQQYVKWSFLSKNKWVPFDEKTQILYEETNGLLKSGIISFDFPKTANELNTILPSGMHWIRAAVLKDSDAICDLIDIQAQAVPARFADNGNDPNHLATSLPNGTVKKLVKSDASVDKIAQPYASFDGKMEEASAAFYKRVSERLRHKQRAITIWDYEHLVLEAFPSIYKVKCANHTKFTGTISGYSEIAPGHVSLVIIPNVTNKNAVNPLQPKTSLNTLSEVEKYISKTMSPSVELHVHNPLYEQVCVSFNVKFRPKIDTGIFSIKLNEEIKSFLAPWAYSCSDDIPFGGRIHKSRVLNFVEERSYVDYVTCFKMFHIVPNDPDNNPTKDIEEAIASTQVSILGSCENHTIDPIPDTSDGCFCPDNEIIQTKELLNDDCGC